MEEGEVLRSTEFELSQDDDVLSQEFEENVDDVDGENAKSSASVSESVDASAAADASSSKDYSHLVVFTAHKAGMDAMKRTKEEINRIIYENSKDSQFFKHALAQDAKLDKRIATYKRKLAAFRRRQIRRSFGLTKMRQGLESNRRLDRIWCVVDMDMFFAAVEMRDDPSLRGKPFGVGGMGMISTANYEARKWGVRSAMPGFIAKKLCPHLVFVKPNFEKYKEVAKITREIFAMYDPDFTSMSLDEASLDITAYVDREIARSASTSSSRAEIANRVVRELRRLVQVRTKGCTASAGIAPNRMLAKIASDRNKPNGQCFVDSTATACIDFMRETALRKIPGVGKVTQKILRECFEISTCGEIWSKPDVPEEIRFLFKADTARWLLSASLGIASATRSDEHKRVVGPSRKGISQERTFSKTKSSREDLLACCRKIAELLSEQMRRKDRDDLWARTLTLKLKTDAFRTITRSRTLARYVQSADDIYKEATKLLLKAMPIRIRLMGIRMSSFRGAAPALARGQTKLDAFVRKADDGSPSKTRSVPPTEAASSSASSSPRRNAKKRKRLETMLRRTESWDCRVCTFRNKDGTFLACSVCRTPRFSNRAP